MSWATMFCSIRWQPWTFIVVQVQPWLESGKY
jgi:hypothetical protein